MLRIGIDTGGTFTDFVALDAVSGRISIAKVPSTPKQPSDAPLAAIRQSNVPPANVERIIIGTTIAANARLQKQGATVLYLGTKGVEDAPIIGRIDRKEAYNPAWPKPDSGDQTAPCIRCRRTSRSQGRRSAATQGKRAAAPRCLDRALKPDELAERWRSLFGSDPPARLRRPLLIQALAYRLQEQGFWRSEARYSARSRKPGRRPEARRPIAVRAKAGSKPVPY